MKARLFTRVAVKEFFGLLSLFCGGFIGTKHTFYILKKLTFTFPLLFDLLTESNTYFCPFFIGTSFCFSLASLPKLLSFVSLPSLIVAAFTVSYALLYPIIRCMYKSLAW